MMEGEIGGGLAIQRLISIRKDNPKVFQIDSSLVARKVGAGSGGFSRSAQTQSWRKLHNYKGLLITGLYEMSNYVNAKKML